MVSLSLVKAKERMQLLGISDAAWSALVPVRPATVSAMLRGLQNNGEVELRLVHLSIVLTEISEAVKPLQLPKDPTSLNRLLDFVHDNDIMPEAMRTSIVALFGGND